MQAPEYGQSLNRHAYVWNNPLTLIDPSGFNTETESICDPGNCGGASTSSDIPRIGGMEVNARPTPPPPLAIGDVVIMRTITVMLVGDGVLETVQVTAKKDKESDCPVELRKIIAAVADNNLHAKAGAGGTLFGEAKFGFGKVRVELFSGTFGMKSNLSGSNRYGFFRLAAPGATLQIGKAKGYLGLRTLEERFGGTTPGGWQEIVQRPDATFKADLTPDDLKDLGRIGGGIGYKFFEVNAELDLLGLHDDLFGRDAALCTQ